WALPTPERHKQLRGIRALDDDRGGVADAVIRRRQVGQTARKDERPPRVAERRSQLIDGDVQAVVVAHGRILSRPQPVVESGVRRTLFDLATARAIPS